MQEVTSCYPSCHWCETDGRGFLSESQIRASKPALLKPGQSRFCLLMRLDKDLTQRENSHPGHHWKLCVCEHIRPLLTCLLDVLKRRQHVISVLFKSHHLHAM